MTLPLTIIPPAQAEALYDAALEDQLHGKHPIMIGQSRPMDDWDDGPNAEAMVASAGQRPRQQTRKLQQG